MSKNLVSLIVFVLLLCIFINGFSSTYVSHNMMNLAYVMALGIDVGENAKLKISAQFTKSAIFSSSSGSSPEDSSSIVLVSGEADSIFSGINLLNTYIGKELNLAHCNAVIFSEEFAKTGISTEIFSLINNEEVRPSTNLIISKCSAYDYLDNNKPNLEKLTTQYYDTFAITSKLTGYISDITIGDFYNDFSSKTCDGTAILAGLNYTARKEDTEKSSDNTSDESSSEGDSSKSGESDSSDSSESSSSESSGNNSTDKTINVETNPEDLSAGTSSVSGKRGTENLGIAVFNTDKYCGELTATETICHLLITNNIDSCIISINNPLKDSTKTELQLYPSKNSKVTTDIKDDKLTISINIKINADILTLEDGIDYSSEQNLEKLSNATKEYLEKEFQDYLNKMSREYGSDIDNFCTKSFSHFATIQDLEKFNIKEKYKNAEFNVNVDIEPISSLLITKT